jgi:hypothetical protein
MAKFFSAFLFVIAATQLSAFVPVSIRPSLVSKARLASRTLAYTSSVQEDLFVEEPEMISVAENFVHAKYKQCVESHGHESMDKNDAREVLRSLLPPVTPAELDDEVSKTLSLIMENPDNKDDRINEDGFVKAIVQNSYWKAAGDLVVKELMYFDALYSYYQTGSSLLNNDDYEALKENLTWEGSSVATMNKQEALFVTAVASARRGDPIMNDDEYQALKKDLKTKGSWVTDRSPDALEKLGINTFMGYLHRAL